VACTVSNGTPSCDNGICGIASCKPGFANCDANATDCETNGACPTGPSCNGLASNCGPSGNESCCTSLPVPGNVGGPTYYRGYDGVGYPDNSHPATVSDFRLDKYEITVGRFRKFVAAYSQTMIASGAGKNPNNSSDLGWDVAWNSNLPATATALQNAVACDATRETWSTSVGTGANETLPINCLSWYEADAFCIWDGGRMPTELEWNYAASGGNEERVYPWSNPPSSTLVDCSYGNYKGTTFCVAPPTGAANAVGSEFPKGGGKFGQADLGGNVWEWTLDTFVSTYPATCDNCATLTGGTNRVIRGGSFNNGAADMRPPFRTSAGPTANAFYIGARCARAP
jgi:formylglycine-generating enzyme required for sulfatase activity